MELTVWDFTPPDRLSFICDMNGDENPPADDWEGVLNTHRLAHRNRLNVNIVPYSHGGNWNVPQMAMEVTGKGKKRASRPSTASTATTAPCWTAAPSRRTRAPPCPCRCSTWGSTRTGPPRWPRASRSTRPRCVWMCARTSPRTTATPSWPSAGRRPNTCKQLGYDRTDFQVFLNNKYQYAPETTFWLLDEPMFRDDFLVIQMFGDLIREGSRTARR